MTAERYTVVFIGLFDLKKPGEYPYLTLDGYPTESGGYELHRGRPPYKEFGQEIRFQDLPQGSRVLVLDVYTRMWGL